MTELSSDKENVPPAKKRKLSLSLTNRRRFIQTSREELSTLEKAQVPKNTEVSSRWALKNLHDWYTDYQERNPESPCPESILTSSPNKEDLNKYLTIFISETRNQNGDRYPPRTIYSLLSGILRAMRAENPAYPNFLDKKDLAFKTFQIALDNLFKKLKLDGIGIDSKHTENISAEEEDSLWASGVLNVSTPKGLLRAVFFICGKCFCLRGGQEHRNLSVSQVKRLTDPDRYVYTENSSKNRPGGLAQVKLDHKSVTIVANTSVGDRCPVSILDKYISKLPDGAIEKDFFYCRPLPSVPKEANEAWYVAVPVGKNVLAKMVPEMCQEAGITGKKTNHSLRVSGATTLFDAGVPERIIQQRTGHRSIEGLRIYERVTNEQEKAVSKILTGESKKYDESRGKDDESCLDYDRRPSMSAQYNNCNVNFYSTPRPYPYPPSHFWPSMPHYFPPASYDFSHSPNSQYEKN